MTTSTAKESTNSDALRRASGVLLLVFAIGTGLAIYLYRFQIWQTLLIIMLDSAVLGLFTFTMVADAVGEPSEVDRHVAEPKIGGPC